METHSDWYNRIDSQINSYKDTLSKKESKKYKLDLLLRVARRVDDFFLLLRGMPDVPAGNYKTC